VVLPAPVTPMTTTIIRVDSSRRIGYHAARVKKPLIAVGALCAVLAASAGNAQDRRFAYEADLAAPAKRAAVRAGGVEWSCSGTRCTAEARGGGGNVSVRGCSELARGAGAVTRYAGEARQLGEKELAECNQLATAVSPAPAPAAAPAPVAAAKPAPPQPAAGRTVTPEMTYTGVWPGGREAGAKQ